uniref:Uncharacterized protein n=1 Tax=Arundo donax TaxID=35708 RepID=A0A0A9ADU3_ARUDO
MYPLGTFRGRFRMLRKLFLRIVDAVEAHLPFFLRIVDWQDFGIKTLWNTMTACVILHIMIIEDARGQPKDFHYEEQGTRVRPRKNEDRIKKFLVVYHQIEDRQAHEQLRDDLVEHQWQLHG